ncbi:MAG: hypothetical protein FWE44_06550 [Defluviitaleaceae bacterium]|nr:hypothetical protein [Defluviitaleaceae bacterium]
MSNVKTPDKKMAQAAAKDQAAASGKKSKVGLIVIITIIALVAGFVLLSVFNVFGIRDNITFPFLRAVPFVGNLIPDDPYADLAPEQIWVLRETELQAQVVSLQSQLDIANAAIAPLEEELEFLQEILLIVDVELEILYELAEQYSDFLAMQEAFNRDVVNNSEGAFMRWFEEMHPELAEQIYREQLAVRNQDERRAHFIAVWSGISAQSAARAIEDMVLTDMRLIIDALSDMTPSNVTPIINALSPDTAALVLRHLEP